MMISQTTYFHNENSLGNCWQRVVVLSCAKRPGRCQKNAVLVVSQQAFRLPLKEKAIGLYLQLPVGTS